MLRTRSRYWCSLWRGEGEGWREGGIVVVLVEGLVSATVATGVVSRGTDTAAVGSVSATVATTEVSRGMVSKCN